MTPKRKEVQDYILKYIDKITKSKENVAMYEHLFNNMDDKQFDQFMHRLKNKEINLCVTASPGYDKGFSVDNNFKIAKELGYKFFTKIKSSPTKDKPGFTTPNEFMVLKLPMRRLSQLLIKKISIPEDSKHFDNLTGQVAGPSRSSELTYPELQVLIGTGLDKSITELLKTRGGDHGELSAMNKLLYRQGSVSQDVLKNYSSGVVSSATLSSFLLGMHIRSTTVK